MGQNQNKNIVDVAMSTFFYLFWAYHDKDLL